MAKLREISNSKVSLSNVLTVMKNEIFNMLNCHNIARVLAFYPENQTVDVEPMQNAQVGNSEFARSIIKGVPLIVYGCKNAYISTPIEVGTIVLLMSVDKNMDSFMLTGERYTPLTTRMHSITDCVAIATFSSLAKPIENYDNECIQIIRKELIEEVMHQSTITVSSEKVDIEADKITIRNAERNLNDLLQELITTIKAITVTQGVISTDSQQALQDVADKIGELLE